MSSQPEYLQDRSGILTLDPSTCTISDTTIPDTRVRACGTVELGGTGWRVEPRRRATSACTELVAVHPDYPGVTIVLDTQARTSDEGVRVENRMTHRTFDPAVRPAGGAR